MVDLSYKYVKVFTLYNCVTLYEIDINFFLIVCLFPLYLSILLYIIMNAIDDLKSNDFF